MILVWYRWNIHNIESTSKVSKGMLVFRKHLLFVTIQHSVLATCFMAIVGAGRCRMSNLCMRCQVACIQTCMNFAFALSGKLLYLGKLYWMPVLILMRFALDPSDCTYEKHFLNLHQCLQEPKALRRLFCLAYRYFVLLYFQCIYLLRFRKRHQKL